MRRIRLPDVSADAAAAAAAGADRYLAASQRITAAAASAAAQLPILSRVLCDSTTRFVGPSIRPSVRHTLLFLGFCGFWPHCSCPNDGVTSIMAPAHPHATRVALYPALFLFW